MVLLNKVWDIPASETVRWAFATALAGSDVCILLPTFADVRYQLIKFVDQVDDKKKIIKVCKTRDLNYITLLDGGIILFTCTAHALTLKDPLILRPRL